MPPLLTMDPAPSSPFASLVEEARRGARPALDRLFQQFYPRVEAMVHRRLARDLNGRPWLLARFSTGDIVQDVFRGVLRDLDGFAGRDEDAFAGYLAIAVRNQIIDAIRFHEAERRNARASRVEAQDFDGADATPDPALLAAIDDEERRLNRVIASLAPTEQLLLRARVEGTATFEELAAQLGYCSESAARRAFYALKARLAILLRQP
jgi:RNA polymerase sigma factor (sigma-70 family)